MANKYIRHGETYCGDGTTSAAATSNGGVGAWNTIAILTGTAPAYGALAGGDKVFIRSKDATDTDITITGSTALSFGSTAATLVNNIDWIIDDGTVWVGVVGTVTYSTTNTFTFRGDNRVTAAQNKLVCRVNTASPTPSNKYVECYGICEGVFFDFSLKTSTSNCNFSINGGALIRPKIKYGRMGSLLFYVNATLSISDLDLELTYPAGEGVIFAHQGVGVLVSLIGGRIYGSGAVSGCSLFSGDAGFFNCQMIGLTYPKTMAMRNTPTTLYIGFTVRGIGADGGAGAILIEPWGLATSRNDGNYPVLGATLPDGDNTPWSWWLYPSAVTKAPAQQMALKLAQYYTGVAETKTITVNLLVADTFNYDKSNLWLDLSYIDNATGESRGITSRMASGSLDTSTAGWSATTYGAVTLLKRKIDITTPTAVKPGTMITGVLRSTVKSVTTSDILFVDPYMGVS